MKRISDEVITMLIFTFLTILCISGLISTAKKQYAQEREALSKAIPTVIITKALIPTVTPTIAPTITPTPYKWINVKATAFCSCKVCCGKTDGITRSGAKVTENVTLATDWKIFPCGTKLYIDGIGERIVQDTGSKIRNYRIDIYLTSHTEALKFGVQNLKVRVIE